MTQIEGPKNVPATTAIERSRDAAQPAPSAAREQVQRRLMYGCMALGGEADDSPLTRRDLAQAEAAIDAALEIGITMFDHADVYRHGKAEAVFGRILGSRPGLREQLFVQSKCGVRLSVDGVAVQYDLSKAWILRAVDESLARLQSQYLDALLLHRPDPLMRYDEVAEAFEALESSGKVRSFGVSNMSAAQMRELQRHVPQPLVACQLEMSLGRRTWIERDLAINEDGASASFPDGTLQYCREHGVRLQAWAPLARGRYSGATFAQTTEDEQRTSALVARMASDRATSREAIVLAWLLKHPADIVAVIGTADPVRIRSCADAVRQSELMSRSEWYSLLTTARGSDAP